MFDATRTLAATAKQRDGDDDDDDDGGGGGGGDCYYDYITIKLMIND